MNLLRLLVVVLLLGSGSVTAQQSFGFVSPNTREGLRLEDAIHGMDSQEEWALLSKARSLGCVVRRKITTSEAVGSWSDGAEHSIVIRVTADELTTRYLVSRLGRVANQKAVVYFHPQRYGRAKIYIIKHILDFNFRQIGNDLDQSGIAFRTLVPARHGTIIYIVDVDNTLGRKVREAAKRFRKRVITQTGTAAVIGDDSSRQKGQAIFAEEIKQYEIKHPKLPPPCASKQ